MDRRVVYGVISFSFMLLLYLGVTSLTSGLSYALEQFRSYWKYILAIATGFGLQMFLYSHVRQFDISCKSQVAASGGVSAGSMVACCLHHVTDLLPIVGSSGAFLILTYYIEPLLLLGTFSSWIGVIFMLAVIQRSGLYDESGIIGKLFKTVNFERVKYVVIVLFAIGLIYYFTTIEPLFWKFWS
jgi:hypothetical protein